MKNALVDRQRELLAAILDDLNAPDLALHLHLVRGEAILSLDGSGGSLHRRGYRAAMGTALKENLAAGLIDLTGWDGRVPLVDPCCGSATLLIEAASAVLQMAQGLNRPFALEGWADFDPDLWHREQARASRRKRPDAELPALLGVEQDPDIADQPVTTSGPPVSKD